MTRSTDMPVGGLTWVGPGTMYYMGIQIPMGKGQLLGLSGPLRSILSHWFGVCSKKINNGISVTAAANCISADRLVYFFPIKNMKYSVRYSDFWYRLSLCLPYMDFIWRKHPLCGFRSASTERSDVLSLRLSMAEGRAISVAGAKVWNSHFCAVSTCF